MFNLTTFNEQFEMFGICIYVFIYNHIPLTVNTKCMEKLQIVYVMLLEFT